VNIADRPPVAWVEARLEDRWEGGFGAAAAGGIVGGELGRPLLATTPGPSGRRPGCPFFQDLHASSHLSIQLGTKPLHIVFFDSVVSAELHHLFQA
jgi:hypothetical protein